MLTNKTSKTIFSPSITFPRIQTAFDNLDGNSTNFHYQEIIRQTLNRILPPNVLLPRSENTDLFDDQITQFFGLLPLFTTKTCENSPANMSFFAISKYRRNAFKFFFEMISHWLIPGNRLNVVLFYAVDFQLPDFGEDVYTLCEVMIQIDSTAQLRELQRNLPILQTEIRLGMDSSYYARRILEVKGLSADAKIAMIQEYITFLVSRLPKHFDYDLLAEMQHVLVICRDEFKAARDCRHLGRIISVHYLFRKALHKMVQDMPNKRHISLKLFKAAIQTPIGNKPILGLLVGINFLADNEVFEERHLLSSIQNCIPNAHAVEGSFFSNRRGNEQICTLYLEIEKSNREEFTGAEIRLLRRELSVDLKDRIEHLMHPVFMPRNEEEIMRNILNLSNQIKYLSDIPQIIISFEEQKLSSLFFTVILVRVVKPSDHPIPELFKNSNTCLEYIHDRSKTVGFLRNKYTKEATVFAVKLPKENFMRRDHSIDLNKARQTVVNELTKVIGEIRDFNGGTISRQNELLCSLREDIMHEQVKYNELLLENFFYSLSPDSMRTVLDPKVLKTLFLMLLNSIEDSFFTGNNSLLNVQTQENCVFGIIKAEDRSIQEKLREALKPFDTNISSVASSCVQVYEIPYLAYLLQSDDKNKQEEFTTILKKTTESMNKK